MNFKKFFAAAVASSMLLTTNPFGPIASAIAAAAEGEAAIINFKTQGEDGKPVLSETASIISGGGIDVSIKKPGNYTEDDRKGLTIKQGSGSGDTGQVTIIGDKTDEKRLNIGENFFSDPEGTASTSVLEVRGAYIALQTQGTARETAKHFQSGGLADTSYAQIDFQINPNLGEMCIRDRYCTKAARSWIRWLNSKSMTCL